MSLIDIDQQGRKRRVDALDHKDEFDKQWNKLSPNEQSAIIEEVNRRLDELLRSPNPNWGSIMNTSIEGGRQNPETGVRGDWHNTVYEPIYTTACNYSEQQSGMLYGNVWKMVIIDRPEPWIGIRADPTFPQRGITLQGKSYFPDRQ